MDRNHILMQYPASNWGARWREALPLGNGLIGAAVYGAVLKETIMLTHGNLWWKSKTPELPDVHQHLPEIRSYLKENKPYKAAEVLPNALGKLGYKPELASPLPLGDLIIKMKGENAFSHYSRSLDMNIGEVKVSWLDGDKHYERKTFVSREDNVIVTRIGTTGDGVEAIISMDRHDINDAIHQAHTMNKHIDLDSYLPQDKCLISEGNFICYSASNDDGTDFGAVVKVIAGHVEALNGSIIAKDTSEILIIIKLFVKGEKEIALKSLTKEIEAMNQNYDHLIRRHQKLHEKIMNKATLNLFSEGYEKTNEELLMAAYGQEAPTALIEKLWTYGRYLLTASSIEGGQPCHLYGLWCGEYQGMWAFNMLNENLQMIYWHSLSGNMTELHLPVFDYYDRLMDDFRENAKKIYGCRGIFIPAPTVPDSGLIKHPVPHILHWTGAAGWLAQHYYDYYRFTGDVEFLAHRALPFMKETLAFYEDFLEINSEGFYVSAPSNSPENTPGNYWKGNGMNGSGTEMETTMNATMDFAIIKELLTHCIAGSLKTGMNKEKIEKWNEMLLHIPAYEINEDGAIKEWMHDYYTDNYHHRHESHVYPVFPGIEITRDKNNGLFEAFEKAIDMRKVVGMEEQTGWSLAHMSNNYARFGRGNEALECLEIMTRSCMLSNFYTSHNDWRNMGVGVDMPWAPIQLDANMGISSAINEMLLFSDEHNLRILPALPDKWRKGKVERLLARGNIEVSIEWDKEEGVAKVTLLPLKNDHIIDLYLPKMIIEASDYKIEQGYLKNIKLKAEVVLSINMKMI